jgi:cellulose synthase/poly-beta-1,6-N-acetylglucosamine synthase-like glycosyltransferase
MLRMTEEPHRPGVDVVVPFAGSAAALRELVARLEALALKGSDTLTIVDNRPPGAEPVDGVLRAPERQSSYFARNAGARKGSNPWLLFVDADVEPASDLLERYFDEPASDRTAVLAGGVTDERVDAAGRPPIAARYVVLRASMSQANTLLDGPWSYAQTANCAIRRAAFEAVGGFRDRVRSGGDADICFRLRAAGWQIEPRDRAMVVHRSRASLRKLLRQQARHGSGAAWLAREHPGSFARASWPGLAKWTFESMGRAAAAAARGRGDAALVTALDPLVKWAFELGRMFPNEVRG